MLEVTKEKATKILIDECIKSGRFYLDTRTVTNNKCVVDVYYHRNYARPFIFNNDELIVEVFYHKLESYGGYKDYTTFARENDYDINARLKEIAACLVESGTLC